MSTQTLDYIDRLQRVMFDPSRPEWLLEHAIADIVGIDRQSAAAMICEGGLPVRVVQRLCQWRGISAHWVLIGEGPSDASQIEANPKQRKHSPTPGINLTPADRLLAGVAGSYRRLEVEDIEPEDLLDNMLTTMVEHRVSEMKSDLSDIILELCGSLLRHLARQPRCDLNDLRDLVSRRLTPFLDAHGLEMRQLEAVGAAR